ncbi:MAG: restriction endonuclease subunit S [Candidatus Aenigmatarchaeota archaeon]
MAVTSVVRLSELEGARRIDAEYYQPEYLEVKNQLLNTKFIYLKNLVNEIIHPKEIKREYEEGNKDYLFLLAQNVRPLMLDLSKKKYISNEIAKLMPKNLLEYGDILFIRTGAVGDVTAYSEQSEKVIASAHILIGKPNFKLSPFYLAIFFNTKLGKSSIIRGTYGALQPEISPEYLKRIPVPILNKELIEEVENLFLKAQDLFKESEILYSQAESLLLSELGLQNFKPKEELFYEVSLSETNTAHRIDAEYFSPKYNEFIEKINNKAELRAFKEFIISVKKGVEVGAEKYQEEGIPFIRVSNLSINGLTDKDQKYITEEDYQLLKDKFEPKEGEILLTKDATPGISYFVKEPIKGIISSGVLRLKVKNIDPEYLCLCINSIIGKSQIERDGGGSIITHWKPNQIKNLLIPILPLKTQQKLAELVQESEKARRKAKQLLEEAKKKVEEEIEKQQYESP